MFFDNIPESDLISGDALFSRERVLFSLAYGNKTIKEYLVEIWRYQERNLLFWRFIAYLKNSHYWPDLLNALANLPNEVFGSSRFCPEIAREVFDREDIDRLSQEFSSMDHSGAMNQLFAWLDYNKYWQDTVQEILKGQSKNHYRMAYRVIKDAKMFGLGELSSISRASLACLNIIIGSLYTAVFPHGKEVETERRFQALHGLFEGEKKEQLRC